MMASSLSASVYDSMDSAARTIAQEAAAQIAQVQRKVVTDIAEIGATLLRVKDVVGHGQFLPWLKAEFGWSERTAQNYMGVAERFGSKSATVAHLPLRTIYALASPSTPDEVREEIVAKLEGGATVEPARIEADLTEARREARRAAEEERRRERSLKGKSKQERERALATHHRREQAKLAERERIRADIARRDQARADAAALVAKALSRDDLRRLLELLESGPLSSHELSKAASQLA